ncbi:MAG: lysylphosphatidylglycerol synthase transmembrane domain-containing protein [Bacillota bacterium]
MQKRSKVFDKTYILHGLKFAIILSLFISFVIIMLTFDSSAFQKIIASIEPLFLLLALCLLFSRWLASSLLIKNLVKAIEEYISLKDALIIYLSGAFVSNVTPFASGGAPFQVYFFHKKGINIGKSSVIVVIQLLLRLFFLGFMTLVFMFFFRDIVSPGAIPESIFYLAFGSGFLISIVIIFFTLTPGIAMKISDLIFSINKIKKLVKRSYRVKRWIVRARQEIEEFHYALDIISNNKRVLFMAGFYTFLNWSLLFMIMPVILKGLGGGNHFLQAYVMQTIFYLVLPFMPTPGASGIAEIGFASLFVSFIPGNLIGLVMFGWRLFTFYFMLLAGGIFVFREIGKMRSNIL